VHVCGQTRDTADAARHAVRTCVRTVIVTTPSFGVCTCSRRRAGGSSALGAGSATSVPAAIIAPFHRLFLVH